LSYTRRIIVQPAELDGIARDLTIVPKRVS
jgi:hypothetical protein